MSQIVQIEGNVVSIGTDNNKIIKVPIEKLNFDNPQVGDRVKAFKDGDSVFIAREAPIMDVPQVQPAEDAPVVEAPQMDMPQVEVPTAEAPVMDVPQVEVPTIETPVIDVPQMEIPPVHTDMEIPPVHTDMEIPPVHTDMEIPPVHTEPPVQNDQSMQQLQPVQPVNEIQQTQTVGAESMDDQTRTLAINEKRINKHIFVWVGNFLFGYLGVDRFLRGQIGLGILKLVTGGAIGVWTLVDFIISLTKAYGAPFGDKEEIVFINGKYAE